MGNSPFDHLQTEQGPVGNDTAQGGWLRPQSGLRPLTAEWVLQRMVSVMVAAEGLW